MVSLVHFIPLYFQEQAELAAAKDKYEGRCVECSLSGCVLGLRHLVCEMVLMKVYHLFEYHVEKLEQFFIVLDVISSWLNLQFAWRHLSVRVMASWTKLPMWRFQTTLCHTLERYWQSPPMHDSYNMYERLLTCSPRLNLDSLADHINCMPFDQITEIDLPGSGLKTIELGSNSSAFRTVRSWV